MCLEDLRMWGLGNTALKGAVTRSYGPDWPQCPDNEDAQQIV